MSFYKSILGMVHDDLASVPILTSKLYRSEFMFDLPECVNTYCNYRSLLLVLEALWKDLFSWLSHRRKCTYGAERDWNRDSSAKRRSAWDK